MFSNKAVHRRFVVWVLSITLLLTVVGAWFIYYRVGNMITNEVHNRVSATTRYSATRINSWFMEHSSIIDAMYNMFPMLPDDETRLQVLESMHNLYVGFADGSAIFGDGWVPAYGWYANHRPWYISAIANPERTVVSPVYIDADTGELTVTFSRALTGLCDYGAVIATDMFLLEVKDMVWESLTIEGSYAFLASHYGNIVVHTRRDDLTPQILDDGSLFIVNMRDIEIYRDFLNVVIDDNTIFPFSDYDYKDWHLLSHPIHETGWMLFLATPESYVQRRIAVLMRTAAGFWFPASLIIIAFVGFVYMRLYKSSQRRRTYLDACPMYIEVWDEDGNLLDINQKAVNMFGLVDKDEYFRRKDELTPTNQPCGKNSAQKRKELFDELLNGLDETIQYEWTHNIPGKNEPLPVDVTLTRFVQDGKRMIIGYNHDLRQMVASMHREIQAANALHNENVVKERLRVMLDSSPYICGVFDEEGNAIDANEAAVTFYGFKTKHEYLANWYKLSPEIQPDGTNSRDLILGNIKKMLATGEGMVHPYWMHQTITGEPRPIEVTMTPVKRGGQNIIIAYARDLREHLSLKELQEAEWQRAQEDKFREVEKRNQFMLDVAPMVIQYWNAEYVCVDCNKTTLNYYGFTSKEEFFALANSGQAYTFQADGTSFDDKWNAFLQEIFEEGSGNAEFAERPCGGTLTYFDVEGLRTEYNNETVVITYATDVTLSREKDRFQVMLDSSPSIIALFDKNANVLDVNQAALEFYGFTSKQEYIDNFRETTPELQPNGEPSIPMMLKMFKQVIETGESMVYDNWMHQSRSGEERPLKVTLVPIQMEDEVCIIAHAIDLRDQFMLVAALNEASIANTAKSRFLAHMSHELRTPLNAILGLSQIELNFNDLSQRTANTFRKLCISGDELLGIMDDILDMSKIETGKMELYNDEYEVPSLLNDTISINTVRIASKDIQFSLQINGTLPFRLFGDALRIKQILNNLISNAIKYTDMGQVTLSVSQETEGEDVALCFIVQDTGQGLKPADLKALFSEYSRFNMDVNRTKQGTGLGLSITKQLVEMMDGTITAESEYGKGTTFTVVIKQKWVDKDIIDEALVTQLCDFTFAGHRHMDNLLGTRYAMPYGRVLVVDDVETNLQVATGLLTPYELQIETSLSGFDAIEKVREGNTYDIIFMDHMMPIMDGIETTRKLREAEYEGVIVVLTANALVGNAEMFMQNGFDEFISKPIDIRQLDAILNKFVRGRHPEEAEKELPAGAPTAIDTGLLARAFKRDAHKALDVIRESLENNDIKLYTVTVHGMKSSLANINEAEMSAMAKKLEEAGDSGNTDYIHANSNAFIKQLETFLQTLQEPEEINGEDVEEDTPFLHEQLILIKNACEDYDDTTAYKAFDALAQKTWKTKTARFIEDTRSLLYSDSDFDGVVEAVQELLLTHTAHLPTTPS
ncbi:MAG: ATP-binding protein [Defluviitaleaceae bacterium]|nr:ATP-binding protein [Defluviitaleaceae bacterium]MCL2273918.1 ATP-binding protein [Defluviitaleaceae bacterium]